eukprot:gene13499-9658_t
MAQLYFVHINLLQQLFRLERDSSQLSTTHNDTMGTLVFFPTSQLQAMRTINVDDAERDVAQPQLQVVGSVTSDGTAVSIAVLSNAWEFFHEILTSRVLRSSFPRSVAAFFVRSSPPESPPPDSATATTPPLLAASTEPPSIAPPIKQQEVALPPRRRLIRHMCKDQYVLSSMSTL